jgi:DNA-binding GntR family transcriptional regulator
MAKRSRVEKQFRSITKLIAEKLREAIVTGKFPPGQRLAEEKLAASLKVSPVALRDALRRLEAEGYLSFGSSEITINAPTIEEIQEYYSIAGVLEGLAARLAVTRASTEEISRLRELHLALKEAYRAKDLQAYFDANSKFHSFITEIARNERLHQMIHEMRHEIRKTRLLSLRIPHRLDYSMREHDQLLDAFLKRNPDLAQTVALKHLENQMLAIKQLLESAATQPPRSA